MLLALSPHLSVPRSAAAAFKSSCLLPCKSAAPFKFPLISLRLPGSARTMASHLGLAIYKIGILQFPRSNCKEVSGGRNMMSWWRRWIYLSLPRKQACWHLSPSVLGYHHSPLSHGSVTSPCSRQWRIPGTALAPRRLNFDRSAASWSCLLANTDVPLMIVITFQACFSMRAWRSDYGYILFISILLCALMFSCMLRETVLG